MVKDVGVEGDLAIEWGVDWGLAEGEELPEDVEGMTEAQYTVWRFLKVLQGVMDPEAKQETVKQAQDRPSGIYVPDTGKDRLN